MKIYGYCPVCKRNKWFVGKRSYIAPAVSSRPITSDTDLCNECFVNIKFLTINQWSLRHYYKYFIMRVRTFLKI